MTDDNGTTLAWAAFGKATSIDQGVGGNSVSFAYGPDDARIEKQAHVGSQTETVLYFSGAEQLTQGPYNQMRRTITLADLSIVDTGGAGGHVLYPVTDNLGGTIAFANANGVLNTATPYGPFGRRETAGWAGYMSQSEAITINTQDTDRGYTGQEELDTVNLVDYNARLYDPKLGRFLSTDPLIAHPESTQSINPYSYVENNPLNATDPSGEMESSIACGPLGDLCSIGGIDLNSGQQSNSGKSGSQSGCPADCNACQSPMTVTGQRIDPGKMMSDNIANELKNTQVVSPNADFSVGAHAQVGGALGADGFMNSPTFREGMAIGMAETAAHFRYLQSRHLQAPSAWQYHQMMLNQGWVKFGTVAAVVIGALASGGEGAVADAGIEAGGAEVLSSTAELDSETTTTGWSVGKPIDSLTRAGDEPSWSTVRARYWKNAAYYEPEGWSDANIVRMRRGLAPRHPEVDVPMELDHINPRRFGGGNNIENLRPLWPWEHAAVDKFRFYRGPIP